MVTWIHISARANCADTLFVLQVALPARQRKDPPAGQVFPIQRAAAATLLQLAGHILQVNAVTVWYRMAQEALQHCGVVACLRRCCMAEQALVFL
jgi:hypothetical protein